jgi:hypothetical protein
VPVRLPVDASCHQLVLWPFGVLYVMGEVAGCGDLQAGIRQWWSDVSCYPLLGDRGCMRVLLSCCWLSQCGTLLDITDTLRKDPPDNRLAVSAP